MNVSLPRPALKGILRTHLHRSCFTFILKGVWASLQGFRARVVIDVILSSLNVLIRPRPGPKGNSALSIFLILKFANFIVLSIKEIPVLQHIGF